PVGYDDEGLSSAFDVAKITATVAEVPELSRIMGIAETVVTSLEGTYRHDLRNSNRLITDYGYAGVLAGKTGFTYKAGHCLASAVKRDGVTMVAVILNTNADTVTASAIENRKLLEAGFSSVR